MKHCHALYIIIIIFIISSCNNNYEVVKSNWPNGNLKTQTEYLNGKKHGKHIEWNEKKIKTSESYYIKDSLDGLSRFWSDKGNLIRETDYSQGKLISNFEYYENHALRLEEYYLNDSINIETGWWPSIKKYELGYINGIENGKWIQWYKNGNKANEGIYLPNLRDDTLSNKYESGPGLSSYTFKKTKNGKWIYWYDNGKMMREENYSNTGLKEGVWKYYNIEEKLIKEENYKEGKLIETKEFN
ncbi:hypothetical protein BH10BAC1_BH10BAC1_21340 [soil metagenome]